MNAEAMRRYARSCYGSNVEIRQRKIWFQLAETHEILEKLAEGVKKTRGAAMLARDCALHVEKNALGDNKELSRKLATATRILAGAVLELTEAEAEDVPSTQGGPS